MDGGFSAGLALFDVAGTLIHPLEPVHEVYARHFLRNGWQVETDAIRTGFREILASIPDPAFASGTDGDEAERAWWKQVVSHTAMAAGIFPGGLEFESCFEDLFNHYAAGSAWSVYPDVKEVLASLREQGWKLAVVSNFDRRLHQVLQDLDLEKTFDLILTSADAGARKPSPELLHKAIAAFPAVSRAFLAGDSVVADGGAAEAAGIPLFLLDRPRAGLAGLPEWVKTTFSQK